VLYVSAPDGFRVGSGLFPVGLRVGSGYAPGRVGQAGLDLAQAYQVTDASLNTSGEAASELAECVYREFFILLKIGFMDL
jgi:hypothetical protein